MASNLDIVQSHPFLHYATINLFVHAEKATSSRADLLHNEKDILHQIIGLWAQVYQDIDKYSSACPPTAVWYGHIVFVEWLLNEDVRLEAGDGCALYAASFAGHIEIAKILLNAGADPNAPGGEHGNALGAAIWGRNAELSKILLDAGADFNTQVGKGGSALQAAAYIGNVETVKILLDAGADVNAQGGKYGTALQAAVTSLRGPVAMLMNRMLLFNSRLGVDTKGDVYEDAKRAAPAAQVGQYSNAVQPQGKDTALKAEPQVVQILIDANADVNAQGGRYGSALLAAVHRDHSYAIEILLNTDADPVLTDELHQTPLHIAAPRHMTHLLSRFPQLASQAAINKYKMLLETSLHLAIYSGHISFATRLLRLGALQDGYGKNAMDWALEHRTLSQEMKELCPWLAFTLYEDQESTVRRSLVQLSDMVPRASLNCSWPALQQLARYFLFLNDTNNVYHLFRARLPQKKRFASDIDEAVCNLCKTLISGTRFVCRICAHMDLCSSCVQNIRSIADYIQIRKMNSSSFPICLRMILNPFGQLYRSWPTS
ncbi:uncharacterized protein N7483_000821 [Penicillium malachiteum]|uniref:uncharacterized protein n=1 Tax=Penicillium malachiteum TaxID=1324776 RepID=UPI0025495301|nr:uncharacterized protein N7483_000821 [Penicillium malachiteum]KAJ5735696.1 hypothetical protein N7483_000821 [Penicillium malachiteum]